MSFYDALGESLKVVFMYLCFFSPTDAASEEDIRCVNTHTHTHTPGPRPDKLVRM